MGATTTFLAATKRRSSKLVVIQTGRRRASRRRFQRERVRRVSLERRRTRWRDTTKTTDAREMPSASRVAGNTKHDLRTSGSGGSRSHEPRAQKRAARARAARAGPARIKPFFALPENVAAPFFRLALFAPSRLATRAHERSRRPTPRRDTLRAHLPGGRRGRAAHPLARASCVARLERKRVSPPRASSGDRVFRHELQTHRTTFVQAHIVRAAKRELGKVLGVRFVDAQVAQVRRASHLRRVVFILVMLALLLILGFAAFFSSRRVPLRERLIRSSERAAPGSHQQRPARRAQNLRVALARVGGGRAGRDGI